MASVLLQLEQRYGVPPEKDLAQFYASLNDPFGSNDSFRSDAPALRLKFQTLADLGQPVSNMAKMLYLERAIALLPEPVEAVQHYKRLHWNVTDRSFDAMVQYISNHISIATVSSAHYAAAIGPVIGAGPPPPPLATTDTDVILQGILTSLQHLVTTSAPTASAVGAIHGTVAKGAAPPPLPRPPAPRGGTAGREPHRSPAAGRPASSSYRPKFYCFVHGEGHAGADCRVMKRDRFYTAAMRRATAPCTIDGVEGHA
jgi:hypothetical protein